MTHPHLIRIPREVLVQALALVEDSYRKALEIEHRDGWIGRVTLGRVINRANLLMEEGAPDIGKE